MTDGTVDDEWAWVDDDTDWVPPASDTGKPSVARMYDYFLGGKDHYAVDRAAADRVAAVLGPGLRDGVLENRAFVRRAVRWIAGQGIDQYLDLGVGLPAQGNVHEFAQDVVPGARVVYVDNDPIVLAHGRALLADDRTVQVFTGDLRRPEEILKNPITGQLIDLTRPVA